MMGDRILAVLLLVLVVFANSAGWAADLSTSRVGRISATEGPVSARSSVGGWADSAVNEPIDAGMSVRTGAQGRAMLRIGAEAIALAPGSEIELAQSDAGGTRLVLRQGRVGIHLSQLDPEHSVEIDISRGAAWLLAPGEYDIAAGDERTGGRLAVLDGRARFVGQGADSTLATGSAAVLIDPIMTTPAAAPDAFAEWWRSAMAAPADPPALQYVAAAMTGYETLDAHGTWRTVAGIGPVWSPNSVPDDWAPYRFGHWRHIAPRGWTWIDDMAWGFAPSHYGRWTRLRGRDDDEPEHWGWVPGKLVANPAYMPAAVAFLGTAGVGLSYPDAFSPAVAWFPLAPGEIYWPEYTDEPDAIRRINATAVDDLSAIERGVDGDPPAEIVHDDYLYRRFASVVPRSVFVAGKPVAPALVQLPQRRLANAPLLTGSPQIAAAVARPVAVAGSAGRGGVNARLAHAVQTLARILKPRGAPAAARAARLVRSGRAPAGHSQASRSRPTHPHIVAATARPGPARLHLAAAVRRR
jgi:hypothetical protein